ncbi:MAG: hypothetical protein WA192_10250 [Candidatus Acidiferrales bacterium]
MNNANIRPAAARAFIRSLNILLKFARMYDFGHPRTRRQYETAWSELRTALGAGTENEAGVLLAVSGEQLLLDGTPLESAAAEKNFARMLSAAGIASIHFAPKVTEASLARFVRGFPTGTGAKPVQLAEQLKVALQGDPHIHVNEVCFVPADSAVARSTVAAQLAARTLSMNPEASDQLFNDPEKLLQLIVAAEGNKGGAGGGFGGSGDGGSGEGGNGEGTGNGNGGNGGNGGQGGVGSGYGLGGTGSGYGPGSGGGYGAPGGGLGPGSDSGSTELGPGGNAVRPGGARYVPETAQIVRDFPSASAGPDGSSAVYVAGASEIGQGPGGGTESGNVARSGAASSTWNIVGGSGGGTPLAPEAGGFWLNKGVAGSADPGQGPGSGPDGGNVASVGSAPSTWNVVGGSGGGTPLAPETAGFWFNKKGDSAGPSTGSPSRPASGSGLSDISIHGSASGAAASESTAGSPASSGPGGSGGGYAPGIPSGRESRRSTGGRSGRSSGRGPGHGPGPGEESGKGAGPSGGSGPGSRGWNAPAAVSDAAEAGPPSRWGNATAGIRGSRSARAGAGSMAVETGLMTLHEDELKGILQMLSQIARTSEGADQKLDAQPFQSRLSTLPRRARFTVSQALSALAAQAPSDSSDKPTLLKLAEHIAIRFAMESYERGDIEVNAVRQVLDEMSQELDSLRKIMGVYEEKMARHGIAVNSHSDVLAQQFWAQVPEEKRKAVLESAEAWCVPPAQIREYVEGLVTRGEKEAAEKVLTNYSACITNKSAETRRQTAMGLAELASVYASQDERLLLGTIRLVGVQLAEERDSELESLVGAAFVRLSQEATKTRAFPAIQRAVELVEYVEAERPGLGQNLRPRIGIEDHLPEFIEDALRTGDVPSGLKDLLRRMPVAASAHLAGRFARAGFREDCDILVSLMQVLDVDGVEVLRDHLRKGSPTEAIEALGLLTRMDPDTVELVLPARIGGWKRTAHDRVVRQIASSGSPDRGRLLLNLFDVLDPLIRPLAVDEIGMCGDQAADMRLLRMAEGDLPKEGTEYLRLKAIEALGRLRTAGAEAVLRKIAETRRAFRWASPSELRLVASQAMEKIDPEWVRDFVPRSGLSVAEFSIEPLDADPQSSAIRQRRYPRLRLEHSVPATTTNLKENCRLDIPELTLGGGVAVCEQSLHPGSLVSLKLVTSQKSVRVQAIVRDANTQARAFEVVEMELEERSKLRKLLVSLGNVMKQTSPQERTRRGTRTIIAPSS